MSKDRVRYLVERQGAAGPRYYWQPSAALRASGWRPRRLPNDRQAAVAAALSINGELDATRRPEDSVPAPAGRGRHQYPASGTIDALVALYRRSEDFRGLRPSTRRVYAQCLATISDWSGAVPTRGLTRAAVGEFYRDMRATPAKAAGTLRVLRLLLAFARRKSLVETNVATDQRLKASARKGRLWSREAVDAFAAAADAMGWHSVGTAVVLDEWIGQREGDVLALRREIYAGGALRLTQAKTGAGVVLPVGMIPRLVARLDAELGRQAVVRLGPNATLLVCETTGRPWKADHFRHVFAGVRAEAAKACPDVAGLWFMHLRHTAVTRLAEANCELPLIAAVTGHGLATVEAIIDRYLIRTEAMARAAFGKRLAHEE